MLWCLPVSLKVRQQPSQHPPRRPSQAQLPPQRPSHSQRPSLCLFQRPAPVPQARMPTLRFQSNLLDRITLVREMTAFPVREFSVDRRNGIFDSLCSSPICQTGMQSLYLESGLSFDEPQARLSVSKFLATQGLHMEISIWKMSSSIHGIF